SGTFRGDFGGIGLVVPHGEVDDAGDTEAQEDEHGCRDKEVHLRRALLRLKNRLRIVLIEAHTLLNAKRVMGARQSSGQVIPAAPLAGAAAQSRRGAAPRASVAPAAAPAPRNPHWRSSWWPGCCG